MLGYIRDNDNETQANARQSNQIKSNQMRSIKSAHTTYLGLEKRILRTEDLQTGVLRTSLANEKTERSNNQKRYVHDYGYTYATARTGQGFHAKDKTATLS